MRGLDPRIHDEAQIQNSCDPDRLRGLMDCRVKPGNDSGEADGAAGSSGAKTALRAFPGHAAERLMVRPGLQARRRRFAPLPGHDSKVTCLYLSGSGMNSISSPGTLSKWPAFQSALACSMRSLRDETKFHQM